MLQWILRTIICGEFEKKFRGPENNTVNNTAMLMIFDSDPKPRFQLKEVHHHTDLLIYQEPNSRFVAVYERDWWTPYYGKGEKFSGVTEYKCVAYHDSCWREDGVGRFILFNSEKLTGLNYVNMLSGMGGNGWYKTIIIDQAMRKNLRNIRNLKYDFSN